MNVSVLANRVEHSKGRALFNLASQHEDVIDLTLGDPDIIPPRLVREAGCEAIMQGKTRYSANAGLIELRRVYADFIETNYGKKYDPEKNIIVTVGGMEALYLGLISSVNPDEEVIIFSPYYINYYQMIQMCGAIPVIIDTKEDNSFAPELRHVVKAITNKTKAIIINSPCNPTGAVYSQAVIDEIINICAKYNLLLISDEVYSSLVYDESNYYSVLQNKRNYNDILVIDSCSKRYSMTGWRVGFAIGSYDLIEAMTKLQENIAACAPLPSQHAAIAAFKQKPDMSEYIEILKKRRDFMVRRISDINVLSCLKPQATFYLFVNVEKTRLSGMEFALALLKEENVAVVPGEAYGNKFINYIRIAFTLEIDRLEEAINRIKRFTGRIK